MEGTAPSVPGTAPTEATARFPPTLFPIRNYFWKAL